jgi:chromosome segregation ATPase
MKLTRLLALCLAGTASASTGSPIAKVLQMIGDLEQKVIAEGEVSQKTYEEYSEFCEDRNKELSYEVKTAKASVEDLKSTIEKAAADIEQLTAKVDDLAASTSEAEDELKKATKMREREAADFTGVEKDLEETIDTISRASGIIEKEMKGGSFVQLAGAAKLTKALDTLVKSYAIKLDSASKLSALMQSYSSDEDEEEDEAAGAPDAAAYESKSGGILDSLADLQSKAEEELASSRKEEAKSRGNYGLKKQSLEDEIKYAKMDMEDAKKGRSTNGEKKAGAEGELATTQKDLAEDLKALAELHSACMSRAADFEAETSSRGEELKALATAKKIIKEATGAAASFLQVDEESSSGRESITMVRHLATAQRSNALARLANRMEVAFRSSDNPFAKVMGMINSMIEKLEKEAEGEATQKAFCDKALAEANAKKDEATTSIDKLNVKIEQGSAKSTKLKEEVTVLQSELAKLMSAQQTMDALRQKEADQYKVDKAELDKGLTGIQTALKVLRDYYSAGDGASGAGGGIISLLEVCESDISKELAEITAAEENAASQYETETQENALSKTAKDKDAEYKQKEAASLDKAGTEYKSDRSSVEEELDANNEGLAQLNKQCVAKVDSYAQKAAKKKAEIDGLKSALSSLGGAAASASSFLQTGLVRPHGALRGA